MFFFKVENLVTVDKLQKVKAIDLNVNQNIGMCICHGGTETTPWPHGGL